MNLRSLARFRVAAEGNVTVTCRRCGTTETIGDEEQSAGLDDLVVWAQGHRCPPTRPVRRPRLVPA